MVLRIEGAFTAGGKYHLEITGLRNANGVASDPSAGFTVSTKPAAPSAADSLKGREKADTGAQHDSIPPAPAKPR